MNKPQLMTRFLPVEPDEKGYTNIFKCSCCKRKVAVTPPKRTLDYEYCPYCKREVLKL